MIVIVHDQISPVDADGPPKYMGFSMDSHVKDLGKWQHEPKINGGTFEDDIFSANIGDLNYWDAWHVLWFDRRCSDVELM